MKSFTIRILVVFGLTAIIGLFGMQTYLLYITFNQEENKFNQTVHIALLDVIKKIYNNDLSRMPEVNPVKRVSYDYYVVDLNDNIDCEILEFYLKKEFIRFNIKTDFEYAIYNCDTDEMVYGNYISFDNKDSELSAKGYFPKYDDLVYYFGIRFPKKNQYLTGAIKIWSAFTIVSIVALIFFTYAIFVVLRQKRYAELQRDFINNMAHEFKTPIASNKIAIEYLKSNELIKNDERLSKYSQMFETQNERLNQQVETILQISQSERRAYKLEKQPIILGDMIARIAEVYRFKEKNASFDCKLPEKPVVILGDDLHLTNVLYSLIDNALKYSPGKKTIGISLNEQNKSAIIAISDNGIGIEKKYFRKIFRKFYRIPTGNIHNVKGFGLGLYYVKKICDRHRWNVRIDSLPGNGTTVYLFMPIYKQ
jgi:two-component system phosphate regulon sensor histidine kinase PhoR